MYAVSCTFTKLGLVDPLYVGESFAAKETECGKGWSFTKVGLLWSDFGVKRVSEGTVFDPGSMTDCLRPKGSSVDVIRSWSRITDYTEISLITDSE